jgi:hypothetical protein
LSSSKIDENFPLYKPITYSSTCITATTALSPTSTPHTAGSSKPSNSSSSIYSSSHLSSLLRNNNDNNINININNSNTSNENNSSCSSQTYENIGKSYMGSYQFPSSHLKSTLTSADTTETTTTAFTTKRDELTFSTSSSSKISSSSRTNDTINSNTLGRTKYQSENYNIISNYSSPVSSSNQPQVYSQSISSIYGTLPKTTHITSSPITDPTTSKSQYSSSNNKYSISQVDNTTSGNFLTKYTSNFKFNYSTDSTNGTIANSSGIEETLPSVDNGSDMYPVQYSSTNPFLPTFNPVSTEKPKDKFQKEDASYLHDSMDSEFTDNNKFESLDKEDDLK